MKKIALINDLSGFGKCSLTAAIPVVSAMGIQACPLPTAVLSAQTGFDSFYYDDYTDKMNLISDEWNKMKVNFDGIYSGYLGSSDQIKNLLYFLELFKNDNNIFIADPVMGDNGKRIKIFSDELLDTMKELTKSADVITPNLTELCLLADREYDKLFSYNKAEDYTERVLEVAREVKAKNIKNQTIIVTGIVRECKGQAYIGNLVLENNQSSYFETSYSEASFSGTGDLFASVISGCLVKGENVNSAVKLAMKFLQPAIEDAINQNIPSNHGVYFEKYLKILM